MNANELAKPGGLRYALDGVAPTIHETAWIAPNAVLIGDVRVGPSANIWFNCVLRADDNPIIVGARTNIQDGTIVHISRGADYFTEIGDDVTIGHSATIHACKLHNRAFVGMGSTVLDGAVIEEAGMIGACGMLAPGKRIGRYELWMGAPAKMVRLMSEEERERWDRTAKHYVEQSEHYRDRLQAL